MQLKYSRTTRGGGALLQIMMFIVGAFLMLAVGWILLLPGLFTSVIESRTGFSAKVDSFYANPFTAEVRMRGLVVVNPAGFAESDFLDVKQFTAKADLFSLFGSKPMLDMSTVDVARITVVTNERGTNNLDLIYTRLANRKARTSAKEGPSPLQFFVRNLDVRLNEVVVKDERPGRATTQVHALAFQRTFRDVSPTTKFNEELPPAVAAAGKNIGDVVTGDLKKIVANVTQPIDRKTYAWGERRENSSGDARKLEERAKP